MTTRLKTGEMVGSVDGCLCVRCGYDLSGQASDVAELGLGLGVGLGVRDGGVAVRCSECGHGNSGFDVFGAGRDWPRWHAERAGTRSVVAWRTGLAAFRSLWFWRRTPWGMGFDGRRLLVGSGAGLVLGYAAAVMVSVLLMLTLEVAQFGGVRFDRVSPALLWPFFGAGRGSGSSGVAAFWVGLAALAIGPGVAFALHAREMGVRRSGALALRGAVYALGPAVLLLSLWYRVEQAHEGWVVGTGWGWLRSGVAWVALRPMVGPGLCLAWLGVWWWSALAFHARVRFAWARAGVIVGLSGLAAMAWLAQNNALAEAMTQGF